MKNNIFLNYQRGDFVEYKGEICEVLCRVDGFGVDLRTGDTTYEDVYVGDIQPISITEDILNAIGFEYFKFMDTEYYVLKWNNVTCKWNQSALLSLSTNETSIKKQHVIYVHQMQQCFRLADVLEIDDMLNSKF